MRCRSKDSRHRVGRESVSCEFVLAQRNDRRPSRGAQTADILYNASSLDGRCLAFGADGADDFLDVSLETVLRGAGDPPHVMLVVEGLAQLVEVADVGRSAGS